MICFFIITLFSVSVSGVDIIHCDIKSCRKFSTQTSSWFTFKKKLKKKLFKQVDRKLHSGEVQSETSLGRSSWTATQSVGKMLPLAKNKVCMCTQRWRHIFKMLLLHWLNKGKTQSGSVASSVEVIVEFAWVQTVSSSGCLWTQLHAPQQIPQPLWGLPVLAVTEKAQGQQSSRT